MVALLVRVWESTFLSVTVNRERPKAGWKPPGWRKDISIGEVDRTKHQWRNTILVSLRQFVVASLPLYRLLCALVSLYQVLKEPPSLLLKLCRTTRGRVIIIPHETNEGHAAFGITPLGEQL